MKGKEGLYTLRSTQMNWSCKIKYFQSSGIFAHFISKRIIHWRIWKVLDLKKANISVQVILIEQKFTSYIDW